MRSIDYYFINIGGFLIYVKARWSEGNITLHRLSDLPIPIGPFPFAP